MFRLLDEIRAIASTLSRHLIRITFRVLQGVKGIRQPVNAEESAVSDYQVSLETREPRPAMVIRAATSMQRITEDLGRIFPAVYHHVTENDAEMTGPPFVRYLSMDEHGMELEAGITVVENIAPKDDIIASELPGGEVAVTWHVGPFDTIGTAYEAIEAWMGQNGKLPAGPPWEVYWTDPGEEPDPAKYRTEVVWPVRDA
jgi:effector-binding domain-containing protein